MLDGRNWGPQARRTAYAVAPVANCVFCLSGFFAVLGWRYTNWKSLFRFYLHDEGLSKTLTLESTITNNILVKKHRSLFIFGQHSLFFFWVNNIPSKLPTYGLHQIELLANPFGPVMQQIFLVKFIFWSAYFLVLFNLDYMILGLQAWFYLHGPISPETNFIPTVSYFTAFFFLLNYFTPFLTISINLLTKVFFFFNLSRKIYYSFERWNVLIEF